MQRQKFNDQFRGPGSRLRLRDRLVYLPGAMILAYGFWLTLTT